MASHKHRREFFLARLYFIFILFLSTSTLTTSTLPFYYFILFYFPLIGGECQSNLAPPAFSSSLFPIDFSPVSASPRSAHLYFQSRKTLFLLSYLPYVINQAASRPQQDANSLPE
jgi:hypothetical protein